MYFTLQIMNTVAHYNKKIIDFRTPILQGKTPVFSIAYRVPKPAEFQKTLEMVRNRMFDLGHPDERFWDNEMCVRSSAHFTDHPLRYTHSNVPHDADSIYHIGIQNGGISKRLTQQIMQPGGPFFTATFVAPTLYDLGFRQGEIIKEVHPDDSSSPISAERRIYAHFTDINLHLSMEDLGYIKYSDFFNRLREYGLTGCNSQIISPMLHFMGVDYNPPERIVIMGDHLFSDNRSNNRSLLMHHIRDAKEVGRIIHGRYDIPIHEFNFIDTSPSGFSIEKVPAITETSYAQMLNGKLHRNISYGLGSFLDLRVLLQVDPLSCPKAEQLIGLNQVQVPGVENVSVEKLLTDGHTSIGSSLGSREKIQIKL